MAKYRPLAAGLLLVALLCFAEGGIARPGTLRLRGGGSFGLLSGCFGGGSDDKLHPPKPLSVDVAGEEAVPGEGKPRRNSMYPDKLIAIPFADRPGALPRMPPACFYRIRERGRNSTDSQVRRGLSGDSFRAPSLHAAALDLGALRATFLLSSRHPALYCLLAKFATPSSPPHPLLCPPVGH
jgi:hypothetical protein